MNKNTKQLLVFVFFLLLSVPFVALAQSSPAPTVTNPVLNKLQEVGSGGGYVTNTTIANPAKVAGLVVRAFINFLGIAFIILMVMAGYNWMTAAGNEEQVKKAQTTIKQSLIGLVVAVSAWTLWNFVSEKIILMQ